MVVAVFVLVAVFTAAQSQTAVEPQPTPSDFDDFDDMMETYLPISPSSTQSMDMLLPTPTPPAVDTDDLVYLDPIPTYGNNTCEVFYAGGACTQVLLPFPQVLTNLSRADQSNAIVTVDTILGGLVQYMAPQHCFLVAHPLLCRYTFPTCDPAYRDPTYQPICRRDCQVVRDFLCRELWQAMLQLLTVLEFDYVDPPDCEPLGDTEAGDAPMCISILNKDFLPQPLLTGTECYSGLGRGYQGTLNVTSSGKPCQSWTVSSPHQHLLAEEGYVELAGGHNYCRNPGERGRKPWCFTTDNNTRWEYCDVVECAPGPTCIPHEHDVCRTVGTIGMDWIYLDTATTDPESRASAVDELLTVTSSFNEDCRSIFLDYICVLNFPSCDTSHVTPRPIEPCQQFCERVHDVCGDDIRDIVSFQALIENVNVVFNCSALPSPDGGTAPECYEQNAAALGTAQESNFTSDCYRPIDLGMSYRGNISITASGIACQPWVSWFPHTHQVTPLNRPELESNNQCRNPDGRGLSPWCYTTDPATRWEYCDIPVCADPSPPAPITSPTPSPAPVLSLYIYVIIGVGAPVLLFLVAMVICTCLSCHRCSKSKRSRTEHLEGISPGNNYLEKLADIDNNSAALTSVATKTIGDVTDNPLYAVNPLSQQHAQQPLEYEGVKLPEFPWQNIFYIKDLGQGHFGIVVQAEVTGLEPGRERSPVAIKVLKEGASTQAKKEFFKEANLMNTFDHPNILKLLGVCIDQEPLCMIFEFMELGDLNMFLRQNSPDRLLAGSNPPLNRCGKPVKTTVSTQQLVCMAMDIAAGLDYLAQNHFVHRDLATRNCLVSRNLQVRISDFGLSQDIYTTDYFKMGDTELLPIRWMPPEAILYAKFTVESDIWSFGVVLWEIFSFGIQPYFSMTNEEVVHHVRSGNVMNCPENCPQVIYDLMLDCWVMEPTGRPKAGEIHAGLQRWNPNISATIQSAEDATGQANYQNMAVVREYAESWEGRRR